MKEKFKLGNIRTHTIMLIALVMTLILLPINDFAVKAAEYTTSTSNSDSIIDTGACGEDVTWSYNDRYGTLTISGEGKMDDYTNDDSPWASYKDSITQVEIKNGVSNIGDYAFANCYNLKRVKIPASVISIGNSTFESCKSLEAIEIPASIVSIGEYAFCFCKNLNRVIMRGAILPTLEENVFIECNNLKVYIPQNASLEVEGWEAYINYVELQRDNYTVILDDNYPFYWIHAGKNIYEVAFGSHLDISEGMLIRLEGEVYGGYVFQGWYKDQECINPWNFSTDIVVEDTVLYGKWLEIDGPINYKYEKYVDAYLWDITINDDHTIVLDDYLSYLQEIKIEIGSDCEVLVEEGGAIFFGDHFNISLLDNQGTIKEIEIITDESGNASDIVAHSSSKWQASDDGKCARWSGEASTVNFGAEGNYISEIRVVYETYY